MSQAEAKATKGRYRKVEVRTWGDEKFRSLSPMLPSGQGLWLFLITGPHTTSIPGLFRAGRAAMAEELGWDQEAFDKAFREVFQQGMAEADFKARVVWVPNAIKHNRPESPNVVKSWASEFDLIPECDLKRRALEALRASVYALGEGFAKAFDETFGKPSAKPSPKAMPNQEQEQEQEQEQDLELTAPNGAVVASKPATPDCPHGEIVALYHEVLPQLRRVRDWTPDRQAFLRARWREKPERQSLAWWRGFFEYVGRCPFLIGEGQTSPDRQPFTADLEWLVRPTNFRKVIEGKYQPKQARAA